MTRLVDEFALTPDVLDRACYSDPAVYDVHLESLRKPLLEEAFVWDLCDGEWRHFIENSRGRLDPRGTGLYKSLLKNRRFREVSRTGQCVPSNDEEWCKEALETASLEKDLSGIVTTNNVKERFKRKKLVASIEKLHLADWWKSRGSSVLVRRDLEVYLEVLRPVLRKANSLMFIDRYLDPTRRNYREFPKIIRSVFEMGRRPLIELHRVVYEGSGRNRVLVGIDEWSDRFWRTLGPLVAEYGAQIEVFVWSDFHDRYLISDLVGLFLGNGFDVDNKTCRWSRLGRRERDEQQREFDPAVNPAALRGRFVIGEGNQPIQDFREVAG